MKLKMEVVVGYLQFLRLVAQTVGMPTPVPRTIALPTVSGGCGCGNENGHAATQTLTGVAEIGEPAPELKLPDLGGKMVDLKQFRGRRTLVLFWNPGCGFCARMLDDLKAWETTAPATAPQLLIVSTGTSEGNQQLGLRSPIVLDQGFSAGRAFGTNGTPSAILLDENGNIASKVAVGAAAVFTLAQQGGSDLQTAHM